MERVDKNLTTNEFHTSFSQNLKIQNKTRENCSKEIKIIKMTKFASKAKNSPEINNRRAQKEDLACQKTLCDYRLVKLRHNKRRVREFDEMKISLNLEKPKWQIGEQVFVWNRICNLQS